MRAQVVDVSTSKTGKHGHAKCKFVAIDIFTGNKMEDMQPSSHNTEVRAHTRAAGTLTPHHPSFPPPPPTPIPAPPRAPRHLRCAASIRRARNRAAPSLRRGAPQAAAAAAGRRVQCGRTLAPGWLERRAAPELTLPRVRAPTPSCRCRT